MDARWPTRDAVRARIEDALAAHARRHPLPGVADDAARHALAMQFVSSLRRQDYTRRLQARPVDPARADPHSDMFDPERAVVHHVRARDEDEAAWLVFLMTHFGNAGRHGWRRLADVYGMLGRGVWTWRSVAANAPAFAAWLAASHAIIGGRFGNHRKYESIASSGSNGTGAAVASYVAWVGASHRARFGGAVRDAGNDPANIFDVLYRSMEVRRFGRLAKFDYLALIGRYGIAPVVPGSAYLGGATGPTRGARLLLDGRVDGSTSRRELQLRLDALDVDLHVGMQAMEDALCNWQKSPRRFINFTG